MLSVILYSLMLDSVTTVAVLSCQGALSAAWGTTSRGWLTLYR